MKFLAYFTALAVWAVVFTSCTSQPLSVPTTGTSVTYSVPGWKAEWTTAAVSALSTSTLVRSAPRDIKNYVASGSCTDSTTFWLALMGRLSKFESGLDPNSKYLEKFPDSKGNRQLSAGLFQMSMDDAAIYGCDFKKEADLYDPAKNIQCMVRAASKLVGQDSLISGSEGKKWYGLARYWSPFRDSTKLAAIQAATKAACR